MFSIKFSRQYTQIWDTMTFHPYIQYMYVSTRKANRKPVGIKENEKEINITKDDYLYYHFRIYK